MIYDGDPVSMVIGRGAYGVEHRCDRAIRCKTFPYYPASRSHTGLYGMLNTDAYLLSHWLGLEPQRESNKLEVHVTKGQLSGVDRVLSQI